jgi:hypothetical protein
MCPALHTIENQTKILKEEQMKDQYLTKIWRLVQKTEQ